MFTGVAEVIFFVTDGDVSRTWYARLLEAGPVADVTPGLAAFQIGQQRLYLAPADEKTPVAVGGQVAYWGVADRGAAVRTAQDLRATLYRGPIDVPMVTRRYLRFAERQGDAHGDRA